MARRLKALALTQPLHELDARKSHLDGADLTVYAMAELALHAIDLVTVAMDFDRGAGHDQVLRRLVPLVAAQAPRRRAAEHDRVARWVLDNLINVGSVDRGFDTVYGTYRADGRYERRRFDFKLLVELSDPAGEIYLRATDEAVTVLVGALDTDVTSAQVAAEITLDNLIRRGRLSDARSAAEAARYRTVQFAEQLRRQLEGTRRNVLTVDWLHAVPTLVDEALTHVEARYRHENAILTHIRRYRDSADDPGHKRAAADLVTIVSDCVRRHTQLQARLLEAFAVFRAEQDRQQFAALPATVGVDLYSQLLTPMLAQTVADATGPASAFFPGAVGIRAPRAPRLLDLVDTLLRPSADRDTLGAPIPTAELVPWEEPARFDDETWSAALALLDLDPDAPRRLSGLLQEARSVGGPDLARLLTLLAVHAVSPRVGPAHRDRRGVHGAVGPDPVLVAVDDGTELVDPEFGGADLLVGRVLVVGDAAGERSPGAPASGAPASGAQPAGALASVAGVSARGQAARDAAAGRATIGGAAGNRRDDAHGPAAAAATAVAATR
jgi:hypothetical protein